LHLYTATSHAPFLQVETPPHPSTGEGDGRSGSTGFRHLGGGCTMWRQPLGVGARAPRGTRPPSVRARHLHAHHTRVCKHKWLDAPDCQDAVRVLRYTQPCPGPCPTPAARADWMDRRHAPPHSPALVRASAGCTRRASLPLPAVARCGIPTTHDPQTRGGVGSPFTGRRTVANSAGCPAGSGSAGFECPSARPGPGGHS